MYFQTFIQFHGVFFSFLFCSFLYLFFNQVILETTYFWKEFSPCRLPIPNDFHMELKKPPKIPPSVFLGNYCVRVSFLRDALCIPCWLWGCWMFFFHLCFFCFSCTEKVSKSKGIFLFREEISKICIGDRALSTGFTGVITSVIC